MAGNRQRRGKLHTHTHTHTPRPRNITLLRQVRETHYDQIVLNAKERLSAGKKQT